MGYEKDTMVKNLKGFSLVELLIVMVISGLFMSVVFAVVSVYFERVRMEKLQRLEKNVYLMMENFFILENRYPCPALRPTNANPDAFGDGAENCASPTIVDGARVAYTDVAANNRVAVGILPEYFIKGGKRIYLKDLIPKDDPIQSDFLDPWGNRLTYAVTVGLMTSATFEKNNGTVAVVDENKDPTNGINNNAHYVVISHGSNRSGAVNKAGKIGIPCPDVGAGPELERPNCAPGNQTTTPFVSALIMKANTTLSVSGPGGPFSGVSYFDDYVFSNRFSESILWYSPASPGTNLFTAPLGYVGVGVTSPTATLDAGTSAVRVDRAVMLGLNNVAGDAARDKTGLLCTTNGGTQTCLDPISLFSLRCPDANGTYQYMKRTYIENKQLKVECGNFNVTVPNGHVAQCPNNGSRVQGIFSDGSIRCTGSSDIIPATAP